MSDPSRRDVLRSGVGVLALAPASVAGGATPADESPIPAPFDAMPTLEDPPDRLREFARVNYPPEAVPDEAPIPDVSHTHTEPVAVTVPEWALEALRWRLDHADARKLDRWYVEEFIVEYAHAEEQYRTPDGRDAVDALLEAVGDG